MKRYKAKLTADYKYTWRGGIKEVETLSIQFVTEPLKKRPTQAFFKSCVKQAFNQSFFYSDRHGLDRIEDVMGLTIFHFAANHQKRKVTNFNFMYIEEY